MPITAAAYDVGLILSQEIMSLDFFELFAGKAENQSVHLAGKVS